MESGRLHSSVNRPKAALGGWRAVRFILGKLIKFVCLFESEEKFYVMSYIGWGGEQNTMHGNLLLVDAF